MSPPRTAASTVRRVERASTAINRAMWTVFAMVVLFSLGNIHDFAAGDAPMWSTAWLIAWLLAPIVDIALYAAITADTILSQLGVELESRWPMMLRIFAGFATLLLNTWRYLGGFVLEEVDWSGVAQHSTPSIALILLAEAAPVYRAAFAAAIDRAHQAEAVARAAATEQKRVARPTAPGTPLTRSTAVTAQSSERPTVSAPAAGERPAAVSGQHRERPTVSGHGGGERQVVSAQSGDRSTVSGPPAAERPVPVSGERHTVSASTGGERSRSENRPALTVLADPAQETSVEVLRAALEAGEELTPKQRTALMRQHWDTAIAQATSKAEVPSGAELARVSGASEATGKRRRAEWEQELSAELWQGGVSDGVSA